MPQTANMSGAVPARKFLWAPGRPPRGKLGGLETSSDLPAFFLCARSTGPGICTTPNQGLCRSEHTNRVAPATGQPVQIGAERVPLGGSWNHWKK